MKLILGERIKAFIKNNYINFQIKKKNNYNKFIFYNYYNNQFNLQINDNIIKGFKFIQDDILGLKIYHPYIELPLEMEEKCFKEKERIDKNIYQLDAFHIAERVLQVYRSIFENSNEVIIERFNSGLRYHNDGKYIYCEQNPNKDNELGQKARNGIQIINVFQNNLYITRVENGIII